MALFKRKKTIVALGHSASGKSCYMQVAISYLFRHGKEFRLISEDTNLDKVTDKTRDILRKGEWPDKTLGVNKYQLQRLTWARLVKYDCTLFDWMGEAFTTAGLEWEGRRDEAAERWKRYVSITKDEFEESCKQADGFLLFLDGERLLENDEESDLMCACLYWLKDLIMKNNKKRRFSILVTKSDFLEGTREFGTADGKVDEEKIFNYIRNKYNAFFSMLENNHYTDFDLVDEIINRYSYLVAPVTCLPVREHRKENANGTFANKDWELQDMEQSNIISASDMVEPLRWLIRHL